MNGTTAIFDVDLFDSMVISKQKIALIKEFRGVSGMGLKDSKDMVEKHISPLGYDRDGLLEEFSVYVGCNPEPFTKEEFLNLVENAIDSMDTFHYTDMADATEELLKNIKKKGGLEVLAKERADFLRKV